MNKEQLIDQLKEKQLEDILELIEDAETGDLEELELVESIGLVHDSQLNEQVISLLRQLGVTIIYVTDDEDE
ncbi:hypothetical protein BEP19_07960 [Ammoniphilus oxalaticus]|uniref:RNA polymerase sigma factor 70 region 1.1 domain-containing protein n=1 Tax=Ammoniphilus oxalaticus TaxID=66863 RepID=A0A419SJY1_9BACL|nr:hypothetical protein [Ammoniphilus oxalaticus]RKD24323.1 hypothetical protein BEP19_07960 [Ammoniphilus oxalaticus]